MNSIRVQRVTIDELPVAARLFDEYRQFYQQLPDPEATRVFLSERLARGESHVFVGFCDDRPAGFMQIYPTFSSVSLAPLWVLNDLFVTERDRRRGVARALLEAAVRSARDAAACRLCLATADDNLPAQRLYESMGWTRDRFRYYELDPDRPRDQESA